MALTAETDRRFIAMLERIVGELKQMKRPGRLADPSSRREVAMLEHRLRTLQARAHARANPGGAAVVVEWSREVRAMSATTRVHTRRKEAYRLRLITGSVAS